MLLPDWMRKITHFTDCKIGLFAWLIRFVFYLESELGTLGVFCAYFEVYDWKFLFDIANWVPLTLQTSKIDCVFCTVWYCLGVVVVLWE